MQSKTYFIDGHEIKRTDIAFTAYAITHKLTPFISMQNQYSLAYREEEREMFPTLKVLEFRCLIPDGYPLT